MALKFYDGRNSPMMIIAVGLFILIMFAPKFFNAAYLQVFGDVATATVTNSQFIRSEYELTFRFDTAQGAAEVADRVSKSFAKQHPLSSSLEVLYSPEDPQKAVVKDTSYRLFTSLLLCLSALAVIAFGVIKLKQKR